MNRVLAATAACQRTLVLHEVMGAVNLVHLGAEV